MSDMKRCETFRDDMIDAYYGELDSERRSRFEEHLRSCPACAAEYKKNAGTLDIMSEHTRPEPGEAFWQSFDDRLMDRIKRETAITKHHKTSRRTFFRHIRTVAAAAVLFIAGMLAGKIWTGSHSTPSEFASEQQSSETIPVDQTAREYLNRAETILLGMMNFDIEAEYDYRPSFAHQKQISRELVSQSAALKENLALANHYQLLELVEDLEVVLLQIAALETDYSAHDIELIQNSAERRAILFKLTVDEIMTEKTQEYNATTSDKINANAI